MGKDARVRGGKGSRLVGGTRLVVFLHPNRPQFVKATSRPSRTKTSCPLPLSQRGEEGEGPGRPPSWLEGGQGSRLVAFFGLYGVKKCGNTTSRGPQPAGTLRTSQTLMFSAFFPEIVALQSCGAFGHGLYDAPRR